MAELTPNEKLLHKAANILEYKGPKGDAPRDVYGILKDLPKDSANTVLETPVPWYGYDGKTPTSGRKTVTLATVIGWFDTGISNILAKLDANNKKLDEILKKLDSK